MSSLFVYNRFSDFVSAVVDPKIRSLAISVSTSTLYLKALTLRAEAAKDTADERATAATNSASKSLGSANDAATTLANFKSLYLGIAANDPTRSALNDPLVVGSFYVRAADQRLRTVVSFNGENPVWADASVAADPASVRAIGDPRYLMLSRTETQTVVGPVAFSNSVTVPDVTDHTSRKAVNAKTVFDFLYYALPVGSIILFNGPTAPTGWVICDGKNYIRSDGGGIITTPDLRGRVAVGYDGANSFGSSYGSNSKTVNTSNNTTGVSVSVVKADVDAGSSTRRVDTVSLIDPGHNHSATVDVSQPSMILNYIMKI